MTNLKSIKVSYHFQNDRQGRKERIDRVVNGNWGSVVKEEFRKDAWRMLTDTGLIFILTPNKELILTYYFATGKTVNEMYHGKAPKAITNRVNKNARAYAEIYNEGISTERVYHKI